MQKRIKGLYSDNIIWINKKIQSTTEKACILAEELGHYHTSFGDILDQSKIMNRKQEILARSWAYKRLVPLEKIISAHKNNVRNKYELADFLNITEEFLMEALRRYKDEYGLYTRIDNFTIYFEPLSVVEMFEG